MNESKKKLFKLMESLNPEFNSNLSEINNPDDNEFTDVRMAKNLQTPAQAKAYTKINTQEEFRQAFENWFGYLGVANKHKDKFNSTTAINHIRDIFDKFDIKP